MDKPKSTPPTGPGYETRDANARGALVFLIGLGIALVIIALACYVLFGYFSAHELNKAASDSPFAEKRQLPMGTQLQVNPREDWLKFREEQKKSLETLAWENQSSGTVRVPIEEAMDLLVKKGLPVQTGTNSPLPNTRKPAPEGSRKP